LSRSLQVASFRSRKLTRCRRLTRIIWTRRFYHRCGAITRGMFCSTWRIRIRCRSRCNARLRLREVGLGGMYWGCILPVREYQYHGMISSSSLLLVTRSMSGLRCLPYRLLSHCDACPQVTVTRRSLSVYAESTSQPPEYKIRHCYDIFGLPD
jgi:hypothetical protein